MSYAVPWWWRFVQFRARIRLWRHSARWLNQRLEVQRALELGAKTGYGIHAEQCRELARKLKEFE